MPAVLQLVRDDEEEEECGLDRSTPSSSRLRGDFTNEADPCPRLLFEALNLVISLTPIVALIGAAVGRFVNCRDVERLTFRFDDFSS